MRLRVILASMLALVSLGGLAAAVLAQRSDRARSLTVTLRNVNGAAVGTVVLSARSPSGAVDVRASVRRMKQGFHGFHVHAVGTCDAPTFMSATGHLEEMTQGHGDHIGDMSSLLVKRNGTATLRLTTDRFELGDLEDADGSAIMVHAAADNFANIPPRYAPGGPDQQTLDTGDSGGRVACAAVPASSAAG